jgi:6-phosphogluconolactonase (cycloisomerase 2 family)
MKPLYFIPILIALIAFNRNLGFSQYDISTADFNSVALSMGNVENVPKSILLNDDGTQLYLLGAGNGGRIHRYNIDTNTPYDISTATYEGIVLDVTVQEENPSTMVFNNDGSRLYMVGEETGGINGYELTTPYDIGTATFDAVDITLTYELEGPRPTTMVFNNNGTEFFVLYDVGMFGGRDIVRYDLTMAYDISTFSSIEVIKNVSDQEAAPSSMIFNDDGTRLYVMGVSGDDINQYDLSTAYDISTATFEAVVLDVSSQESRPSSMLFNDDGSRLYVMGEIGRDINQYELSTAYDISTATFEAVVLDFGGGQENLPSSMLFNDDGSRLYVMGTHGDDIDHYDLSTDYDISTAVFNQIALSVAGQETIPTSMIFNNDGSRLYVMGTHGDDINQYDLSTDYDISTAVFNQIALSVAGQENLPSSMLFNNDGSRLYVMGEIGRDINQYELSTAYDISTATFEAVVLEVNDQEAAPTSMIFNDDGTRLYVMGVNGDDINQYDLSTDYDISTAVFNQIALSVAGQENSPTSMIFNNDGSRLYVVGTHGADINQYDLEEVLSLGDVHLDRQTLYPNPVQEKLYVLGLTNPQPYTLYNLLGVAIASGTVSDNTPIAVQQLNNGIYFLQFENGKTLKFIKK